MSGIKKPTIKKPINGLKKPVAKPAPATKMQKPNAPKMMESVEVVEEKVVEIPVVVDQVEEVAPELFEEDDKFEEKVIEEIIDDANKEEDICTPPEPIHIEEPKEEPVIEVKEEPKTKKKASKKSSKKKEEPKEVVEEVTEPNMSLGEALNELQGTFEYTTPEWEEAKEEIKEKLASTTIDPDADPGTMRVLIAELDEFISSLRIARTYADDQVKAVSEMVEYIRLSNAKGTNSEERKASGYKAIMNYKADPSSDKTINLVEYKLFFESQLNFYNETIETLKDRKQLLITFSSMMKIESNF